MSAFRTPSSLTLLGIVAASAVIAMGGCSSREHEDLGATSATAQALVVDAPVRKLADTPFEQLWDLRFPSPVWTCYQSADVPETLFFQLQSGELAAVDAMSGHTRWITTPLPELLKLPPYATRNRIPGTKQGEFINDDRLYVVAQDILTSYDVTSGQVVWSYQLPFGPSTGPCAIGPDANLRVYLGDWAGYMRVVTLHPEKRFPYIAWQWNISASSLHQPVVAEEQVYLGDQQGKIHSFRTDRDQAWEFNAGGAVNGAPAVRGKSLFVGGNDNILFALNRLTGEELGRLVLNGPVNRQPLVFDTDPERIFVWVDSPQVGGLYAIRAQDALVPGGDGLRPPREVMRFAQEWYLPNADTLVSSTPQYLYVTTSTAPNRVLAVSRTTGRIDWQLDLAAEQGKAPAYLASYHDRSDRLRMIITGAADGRVVTYRFFGYVPQVDNGKAADTRIEAKPAPAKADKAAAKEAVAPAEPAPAVK